MVHHAKIIPLTDMNFAQRLVALRKDRHLTQQSLAERVGIHVSNIRRYEAGTGQPTMDVLRNLALALNVSADSLLFDNDERGPTPSLRLHLEAASNLDDDEQAVIRSVIEGLLLKHEARRFQAS
jgi:transcriptional regulator with XRE-family HTH domain